MSDSNFHAPAHTIHAGSSVSSAGTSVIVDLHKPESVPSMTRPIRSVVRSLCIVLVAAVVVPTTMEARVPKGFTVRERSNKTLSFSYVPLIRRWDTVAASDGRTVRPVIDGAQMRASADGSFVQWTVSADIIVPGPSGFRLDRNDVRTFTLGSSLPFTVQQRDGDAFIRAPRPLTERVVVSYDGIAGDRHMARVTIVVASRENGRTTITQNADVQLTFTGIAQGTASGPSTLDVLNPQAPWQIARTPGQFAKGENVQAEESFTNMLRMTIDKEGIYRVTSDQLRNAGVPTDAAGARSIRVFGRGGMELPEPIDSAKVSTLREQPIIVRTNGDGSIRDVIFYASATTGWAKDGSTIEHYINHYSTSSAYYLTYGGADGIRASARPGSTAEPTTRPSIVTGRVFNEEEIQSPYSSGSGRRWFGRTIENGGSIVVNTLLPGLVRSGNAEYRYVVAHRGSSSGTATFTENSTFVAQSVIRAVPKYMDAYSTFGKGTISAQVLPADGRSVLKIAYSCPDKASSGMLDWFEIHYPRQLQAADGEFEFWSVDGTGVHEYAVNGFSGDLFGVDVTDRTRPQLIENVSATGGMFVVREDLGTASRRYFLSSNLRSTSLSRITYPNLSTSPRSGDLLVITHPQLQASAQRYADYRTSKGKVKATVITTDEIYAQFSYGMQDPTAIRDFIAMAYAQWSPRPSAVLFWGDGHFDYKNISTSQTNFIIPYESLDPDDQDYGLVTYTTDDFFVRVAGNDNRPELALGRLPVTSNSVGDRFTDKIRNYEGAASLDDWRTRITLIADDGQQGDGLSDRDTHLSQNETLAASYIPKEFQIRKLYMVEYPTENVARGRRKPTVTQDMVSTINTNGTLILNWIGHGNPRVWAHEQIFTRETTPQAMSNVSKPFFLTAATCDFARWDMTELQSGAEELMLLETGGAIGVFSAARVVFSLANAELNEEFYSDLFTRDASGQYPTLGEAMYRVKQKYNGNNDEKFHLLGDPTLRILVPEQRVRFTKLNGQDITKAGQQVTVSALSTVVIEGDIIGSLDSTTDASFSGNVTISLLDAQRTLTVVDTDVYNTINTFTKSGPALCRGSFVVENGKFTGTFVVPKDISFSSQSAGLYGYAASDDQRFAMGVTDRVVVDGVTSISDPETDGPAISIYLDSRKFLAGGIVRPNPILIVDLEDATGINTTGVGIGHDIQATFNNGGLVEILTPNFTTSLTNSRAGSAQKQIFGLGAGLHNVHVQAWDVLNNVSEASTTFRIVTSEDGIPAEGVTSFPNPFSTSTTIRFTHASPRPFEAVLLVYDVEGREIAERPMRVTDMQTADVTWDGRDNAGALASTGMYQAVVRLTDEFGGVSFVSGKLSLIR